MTRAEIEQRLTALRAKLDGLGQTSDDPAAARLSGRTIRRHQERMDRDLATYALTASEIQQLEIRLRDAEVREQDAARVRPTREQIATAQAVRWSDLGRLTGWADVVRTNAQSVTVAVGDSLTKRVPFDKIREVR